MNQLMEVTRSERREQRRRNQRKMHVSGASVRLLWKIVLDRAKEVEKWTSRK